MLPAGIIFKPYNFKTLIIPKRDDIYQFIPSSSVLKNKIKFVCLESSFSIIS
jgi:hypothetical protein